MICLFFLFYFIRGLWVQSASLFFTSLSPFFVSDSFSFSFFVTSSLFNFLSSVFLLILHSFFHYNFYCWFSSLCPVLLSVFLLSPHFTYIMNSFLTLHLSLPVLQFFIPSSITSSSFVSFAIFFWSLKGFFFSFIFTSSFQFYSYSFT